MLVIPSEMRHKRKTRSGATYHVVARANRREFILADENIKQLFLDTVQRAKRKYAFTITNICILDNHFHLMITPAADESISDIMRWILSVFAMAFNREHGYIGHVWYDRFKSKIIESLMQFIATFAYISENPVRARIVDRADKYRFGGYALMRDGPAGVITPPSILVQMLFPAFASGVGLLS